MSKVRRLKSLRDIDEDFRKGKIKVYVNGEQVLPEKPRTMDHLFQSDGEGLIKGEEDYPAYNINHSWTRLDPNVGHNDNWACQIAVYGDPDLRDRIVELLDIHGYDPSKIEGS